MYLSRVLAFKFELIEQMKEVEIWLSRMTKVPTPTEKSKKQREKHKNATKNFDYTTISDRLRMVSWGNDKWTISKICSWYSVNNATHAINSTITFCHMIQTIFGGSRYQKMLDRLTGKLAFSVNTGTDKSFTSFPVNIRQAKTMSHSKVMVNTNHTVQPNRTLHKDKAKPWWTAKGVTYNYVLLFMGRRFKLHYQN